MNAYKGNWKKLFRVFSRKLGITITRDNSTSKDIWTEYITLPIKEKSKNDSKSTSGTSTSSITSSIQYQKELSVADRAVLNEVHKKISFKWKLKSGTVVEDTLYNDSKDYKYEQ